MEVNVRKKERKSEKKKTCPTGQKLVNGVCVPIEKPKEAPTPKDIGKRYYKDKPAEYFQPSTGEAVTTERAKELAEPRTYTYGQKGGLTKKEFEEIKRTPALQPRVIEEQRKKEEAEALREMANIEELKKQILQPDLLLRGVGVGEPSFAPFGRAPTEEIGGVGITGEERIEAPSTIFKVGDNDVAVPNEQIIISDAKRQIKGLITTRIDENTSVISAQAQLLMEQVIVKTAKVSGASIIDKRLGNMEQALVNHREGGSDILKLMQSGAYEPQDAMTDVQNMVEDVAIVEQTMQLLAIHSPAVYSELKGWEYTTRIIKIRRGLLNSQQQIINFAEFGTPLPPDSSNLAYQLNELQNK